MICAKCRSEVADNDAFCGKCGEKIERAQCPALWNCDGGERCFLF